MHLPAQGLPHFPASDIGNGVKSEAVEQLVVVKQILPYTIHHQMKELVLFVQEERHGEVPYLLLRVFVGGDEVDGFQVSEIDVPAQNVDVQELKPLVSNGFDDPRARMCIPTLQTYF